MSLQPTKHHFSHVETLNGETFLGQVRLHFQADADDGPFHAFIWHPEQVGEVVLHSSMIASIQPENAPRFYRLVDGKAVECDPLIEAINAEYARK